MHTKINVLGVDYTVKEDDVLNDEDLEGLGGYCNFNEKTIIINKKLNNDGREREKQATIRHEIIHAVLHESGLDVSSWGRNEEIVDWIALQYPKFSKLFKDINVEE